MTGSVSYDPTLVLSAILKRAATAQQCEHAFVACTNPRDGALIIEFGIGLAENYVGIQLKEGVAVTVRASGEPLIISNYMEWAQHIRQATPKDRAKMGTVAGAPALVNGSVEAVLVFIFEEPRRADHSELRTWLAQVGENASEVLAQLDAPPVTEVPPLPPKPPADSVGGELSAG